MSKLLAQPGDKVRINLSYYSYGTGEVISAKFDNSLGRNLYKVKLDSGQNVFVSDDSIKSVNGKDIDSTDSNNLNFKYKKCECGTEKVHGKVPGNLHEKWCPKHPEFKESSEEKKKQEQDDLLQEFEQMLDGDSSDYSDWGDLFTKQKQELESKDESEPFKGWIDEKKYQEELDKWHEYMKKDYTKL